jgi:MYXO-CTERM domain-containing protein
MSGNQETERLSADIERQRDQLADTVDALHDKLDVKAHAKHKAAELHDRSTTATGKPRPELIGASALAVALLVGLVVWRRRR